jgi:hypothetical protein
MARKAFPFRPSNRRRLRHGRLKTHHDTQPAPRRRDCGRRPNKPCQMEPKPPPPGPHAPAPKPCLCPRARPARRRAAPGPTLARFFTGRGAPPLGASPPLPPPSVPPAPPRPAPRADPSRPSLPTPVTTSSLASLYPLEKQRARPRPCAAHLSPPPQQRRRQRRGDHAPAASPRPQGMLLRGACGAKSCYSPLGALHPLPKGPVSGSSRARRAPRRIPGLPG